MINFESINKLKKTSWKYRWDLDTRDAWFSEYTVCVPCSDMPEIVIPKISYAVV
jgi:hypothetical protein